LQRIATLGVASALEQHPELMPALVCRDGRLLSREVAEAQGRAWPDGEETP
jgi:hypothetical protein